MEPLLFSADIDHEAME